LKSGAASVGLAVALLSTGTELHAEEWALQPDVRLSAEVNDNPRLLYGGGGDARGLGLEARLEAIRRTEISESAVQAGLHSRRYSNYSLLDGDDQSIGTSYARAFEHGKLSVDASVLRDHTLTSELETTGFVEANRRRQSYHSSINLQTRPWEHFSVGTQLTYDRVDFDYDPFGLLVDYYYPSAMVFAQSDPTDRTSFSVTAGAGGLRGAASVSRATDYYARLGFQRQVTEGSQIGLAAGPSILDPQSGAQIRGLSFVASFDSTTERNRWHVEAVRERRPNGSGVLGERTELSVTMSRNLTEHLSGDISLRAVRNEDRYGRGFTVTQQRNYGRAEAHASWRWSPRWQTDFSYVFSTQRYPSTDLSAHSNQISLSTSWSGSRLAASD
jgi:hypothetical protein